MIEIENIRIEEKNENVRLVADIKSDFKRDDDEKEIWFSINKENKDFFSIENYDAFLFIPVYMAMYYKSDLHIHGNVSKKLYRNIIDYIVPLLVSFSDKVTPVNVFVDGFAEVKGTHHLNGTGFSCGVDNLATVYKYSVLEKDNDYKLNSLFMLNCGWHGKTNSSETEKIFNERFNENKKAADELKIPLYKLSTNIHSFLWDLNDQASYFCLYSCVFAMEKVMGKYYLSSSFSYGEVLKYGKNARNSDWSEYADPMALPLIASDNLRIISDGCQYSRSKKTEMISDWDISKKYLNVCFKNDAVENCSICHKCVRTLLVFDAMGKLGEYKNVFNIDKYKKISFIKKCELVVSHKKYGFLDDNFHCFKRYGKKLPSYPIAFVVKVFLKIKNLFNGK